MIAAFAAHRDSESEAGRESMLSATMSHLATPTLADWSASRVATWLSSSGRSDLSDVVLQHQVDGLTLLEMDGEAWKELGVSTSLERAKLMGHVKRASINPSYDVGKPPQSVPQSGCESAKVSAAVNPPLIDPPLIDPIFDSCEPSPLVAQQDGWGGKNGTKTEFNVVKHFVSGFKRRTPEGGAEHRLDWMLSFCNANRNPTDVKKHCLRFMNMYNLIDLLVLTIDLAYLSTAELEVNGPETFCSLLILLVVGISALMSGFGMLCSTVMYNTASAVGSANFIVFAKLPSTLRCLKFINDTSFWSGWCTVMCVIPILWRLVFEIPGKTWTWYWAGSVVEGRWWYAFPALCVPALVCLYLALKQALFAFQSTNLAMFGGLFSSEPIAPLADDIQWAHRASPEQIASFVAATALHNGKSRDSRQVGIDCAQTYAMQTIGAESVDCKAHNRDSKLNSSLSDGSALLVPSERGAHIVNKLAV
eukprot:TRINITY_DN26915_c0_g1_i1.p1 TRINITY_DN26915_c0_g1~~TRINITY_DN26915_c0_g1_i1.p1  ORF type:complete len:477 (+),score=69.13 TRINITY_DN26915_c0_g1_i1:22-1452(+)